MERFRLDGQTAVVTGGSSGIGRTITELFAADGADAVACSRTLTDVEAVAEEIAQSDRPGEVQPVECDATDREDVEALADAVAPGLVGTEKVRDKLGGLLPADSTPRRTVLRRPLVP
ncbi:SDR family NAD(P)-dependent oxidoreductase [Halorussus salinisoli]|uniref:SDR family NAD(P)-dependent oxidoreductase n=1 Tax=Halorussus salinisoli TaxID=2558242 RepID=UPI0037423977